MEAIVLCGVQGSGKTTLYRDRFATTHEHVSLDVLGSRAREAALVAQCLEEGRPFVVDNTNPTVADRARYLAKARAAGFECHSYLFEAPYEDLIARNAGRQGASRVPDAAIRATLHRLEPPTHAEGFDRLFKVIVHADGRFDMTETPP